MPAEWFTTASGRRVILEQFLLERFALGVLEGRPELIRRKKLEELPERIRKRFPGNVGHLILAPPPAIDVMVPEWLLAASLHCFEPVATNTDAHCSGLVVIWFAQELPSDLPAMLRYVLGGVKWEAHAVDGWY
jgi:hypothetical protein